MDDPKWSYNGLLPYFRKIEHYHTTRVDANEHGYDGPIYTQAASSRKYPLRDQIKITWASVGMAYVSDANSGSPQGLGELVENRRDGMRQLASAVYPLVGVRVITQGPVRRVLFEKKENIIVTTGVELADERVYWVNREVFTCAGAYRTPQVLLLSGIGPVKDLSDIGVAQVVDAPLAGRNLHDLLSVAQW